MTEQSVATFLPCVYCEYDLRGLAESTDCPECGAPLRASTDLEIPGPVSSITWIRRGLLSAVISLCVMCIYAGLALVFGWRGTARLEFTFEFLIMLSCSLQVMSSWWLTTPCDRSALGGLRRKRLAVRTLALVSAALGLLVGRLYYAYAFGFSSGVGLAVAFTSMAMYGFWLCSLGLYLGSSIVDVGLAGRIRLAAGIACAANLVTSMDLLYDATWPGGGQPSSGSVVAKGILGICGLLSELWFAIVLLQIRNWYSRILDGIEQRRHAGELIAG